MTVFVVLHADYGDQGVAFHGVFKTKDAAQKYVESKETNPNEQRYWEVQEEEVQ